MSSTLLEATRAAHEELERLERLIAKDLQSQPPSTTERLYQGHRIRGMIDTFSSTTQKLVHIYEDKDNSRKEEIAALGGQTADSTDAPNNAFIAFYDRLRDVRESHRKHPAVGGVFADEEAAHHLQSEARIKFSGEEGFGRYLDLHELHHQYMNSKFGGRIEYVDYLDVFSQPNNIVRGKPKPSREYEEYLGRLLGYLISFYQRTEPLQDLDRILSKLEIDEFEDQYGNTGSHGVTTTVDLDCCSSVEELMEAAGPEKLKEALAALGLKTGGTLRQRAERLFLTKDTPLENLESKHFVKVVMNLKEIGLLESKVGKLCDLLKEAIQRTKQHVVRKQSLTNEEMEEENRDGENETDVESEGEDEEEIYNPLKLPLGVDGRPIPYWLYKLHGLGQEFKCEICGNYSYRGRRAFEQHFKEWRHQNGLRCLGIRSGNKKYFNEITSMEEARELWRTVQVKDGEMKWQPNVEEEYEDKEGNVYNKKTYEDLKRQGLI